MSPSKPAGTKAAFGPLFATGATADAQARAAQLFSHQNELMINAARALWDSQTRLLQMQAEQAASMAALPVGGGDPREVVAACCQQWHDSSERLIAHWRQMNDLMRDAHWQLFEAQAENLRQLMRPASDTTSPAEPGSSKA